MTNVSAGRRLGGDDEYISAAAARRRPVRALTLSRIAGSLSNMTDATDSQFASLRPLFAPRTVAVIGASADPTRIGGRPLSGCLQLGYAGGLFPVNPTRAEIQGLRSYPSVEAIGEPVDLALIALPAAQAVAALEGCARAGVRAVVVLSAGFAEVDAAGAQAQARMVDIARAAGIRLVGPNCMGLINLRRGLVASFTSLVDRDPERIGGISVVAQSGAYGSHCLALMRERGLGLNLWATTGNQADVDVADCLAYMAQDEHTKVIVGCIEGVTDGPRFVRALALARSRRVPVVLMKLGRSDVGREAAVTHTAALAGSDRVFDAVLEEFGVHRARDIDELYDVAYACTARKFPVSADVGLLTTSGGFGIVMADAASDYGLAVPALSAATQARLKALVPFASTRNPVDVTGQFINDPSATLPMFEMLIRDGGFAAIVCYIGSAGMVPRLMDSLLPSLAAIGRRFPDHLLLLSMIARAGTRRQCESLGWLVFENPTRAVAAVAALRGFGRAFAAADVAATAPAIGSAAPGAAGGSLDEAHSKQLLRDAGVPVPDERSARSAEEAAAAADAIGYPVAMKILSPDIVHKSDIGGVALGVADRAAVLETYDRLRAAAVAAAPSARIVGVLVSPMISDGIELIVGVNNDPVFGPVVVCGLGGVLVEVLAATTLRRAPFAADEARRMIAAGPAAALLAGVRGRPAGDVDALADALAALSRFAAANADWLASVDINPLVVRPTGRGVVALDAVIAVRGDCR
jgi:acyl-CoA synthetase (NDP forming)